MDSYAFLKAQKDSIVGEDKFAIAVRILARLREAGFIRMEGDTEIEVRENLYKAQTLVMQVINAAKTES